MSLLPLELYSAGCVPVVNDAACTRSVGYKNIIHYARPTPSELADGLFKAIQESRTLSADSIAKDIDQFDWQNVYQAMEKTIVDIVNNGYGSIAKK